MGDNTAPNGNGSWESIPIPYPMQEYYLRGYRSQEEYLQDLSRDQSLLADTPYPGSPAMSASSTDSDLQSPLCSAPPPLDDSLIDPALRDPPLLSSPLQNVTPGQALQPRTTYFSPSSTPSPRPFDSPQPSSSSSLATGSQRGPFPRDSESPVPPQASAIMPVPYPPNRHPLSASISMAFFYQASVQRRVVLDDYRGRPSYIPRRHRQDLMQGIHLQTASSRNQIGAATSRSRRPASAKKRLKYRKPPVPVRIQPPMTMRELIRHVKFLLEDKLSKPRFPLATAPSYSSVGPGPAPGSPQAVRHEERAAQIREKIAAEESTRLARQRSTCFPPLSRGPQSSAGPPPARPTNPLPHRHCWIDELSDEQLNVRERTAWEQFRHLFDADPRVLVDRRLRLQATATPPQNRRVVIHVQRDTPYFHSLVPLLAPRDFAMHCLHRVLVQKVSYGLLVDRSTYNAWTFTAWTFDDLFAGLHSIYDWYPQGFCTADASAFTSPSPYASSSTVTSYQLLDFRCGNPFDGQATTWPHTAQGTPLHHHDALQWNDLPGMRLFVSGRHPDQLDIAVDVQYKRVSAADHVLAAFCGVHLPTVAMSVGCHHHQTDGACFSGISAESQMAESFVYIVRLVAFSARSGSFYGPYKVMKTGGWVVPPRETRLRLHESSPAPLRAEHISLPRPTISRAVPRRPLVPFQLSLSPNFTSGQAPEVWTRLADPAMEDVLWMASKLATGTTYKGFQVGGGTGLDMTMPGNQECIGLWKEQIRYRSPSRTAALHSDMLYEAHLAGQPLDDF